MTLQGRLLQGRGEPVGRAGQLPATGNGTILTRGWKDPENSVDDYTTTPIVPGQFVTVKFDMQAKDAIVPAGRRLGLMVFSSDRQYTIRPAAGTQLTLDLGGSSFTIPVVGGASTLAAATGDGARDGAGQRHGAGDAVADAGRSGRVRRRSRRAWRRTTPRRTTANVISTAGDATLSVADPSATATGHLVNGAFSLPQALQVALGTARSPRSAARPPRRRS